MTRQVLGILTAAVVALAGASCGEDATSDPAPQTVVPDAEFHRARSAFVRTTEERIARVEHTVQQVEDRASSIAGDMRPAMEEAFADVREDREKAKHALDLARTATLSDWDHVRRSTHEAVAAFEQSAAAARNEVTNL